MKRACTLLILLLTCAPCSQAHPWDRWASARERRLKGPVRTLVERCSSIGPGFKYGYRYEFASDGRLMVITSFQLEQPAFLFVQPSKVTRRNERGDAAEASFFYMGELARKERYEIEYDGIGNWTKLVTYVMRKYDEVPGDGTAGTWMARDECQRTIDYYP